MGNFSKTKQRINRLMDISAEAVQLIVKLLIGLITGFVLGSVWKWLMWFR
jgi:hypothetical protein